MQPYIFPYIGYFQLISSVDNFVILDDVNFIKRGWINRNRIIVNGNEHLFTIPLNKASQNKLINEINLSDVNKWRKKFLLTIENSYKKAPQFNRVFPLINQIIKSEAALKSTFIYNSIKEICNYLRIETHIIKSSYIYSNNDLKGQYRILDICEKENSTHYINPIGGKDIYNRKIFKEKNIRLSFISTKLIKYKQRNNTFIPNLSIIDILMFNSIEEVKIFLSQYELV